MTHRLDQTTQRFKVPSVVESALPFGRQATMLDSAQKCLILQVARQSAHSTAIVLDLKLFQVALVLIGAKAH
jgi:hypothetical protein